MGLFKFFFGKKSNQVQTYLNKDAVILDVRTQSEYDEFHFENAIHIPISDLESRIAEVKHLNKSVIAHCRSGVRSERAKQLLNANGIDAINGGGVSAMKKALQQD